MLLFYANCAVKTFYVVIQACKLNHIYKTNTSGMFAIEWDGFTIECTINATWTFYKYSKMCFMWQPLKHDRCNMDMHTYSWKHVQFMRYEYMDELKIRPV